MYSKDDDESGRLFDYIFSVCLLIICLLRKKRKSVGERERINFHVLMELLDLLTVFDLSSLSLLRFPPSLIKENQ